ncbi:hypothetical protein BU14_0486s0006 [Porphyra umbilicalis]|uniref:Uncharacterized protein n=1 Tax=Porphyra umbilicalis TaxID=2786 RepID=A0A1X6NTY1_PORUM|nr:hypothetical protein BU14_0486s0006 [Porphyra umbilicalis]|eukprot:OSX71960.1 hypothetical protein BU14_0486s0006 [Porphyra umbilicalis]
MHARQTPVLFPQSIGMDVAKVNDEDAKKLLTKIQSSAPASSPHLPLTMKFIKLWQGKARNNVHFNAKTYIFKAWLLERGEYGQTKNDLTSSLRGTGT